MNETPPTSARPDPVVTRFADGIVDQHRRVEKLLRKDPPNLEWQPTKGRNSIGMLLAHNAIVEVWWIDCAPHGLTWGPASEDRVKSRLGIGMDADGMPAKPESGHAAALAGWTLDQYFDLLAKARTCTAENLATWRDAQLDETFKVGKNDRTRGWILYHCLEHFAQHAGQIALLAAMQKQAAARG